MSAPLPESSPQQCRTISVRPSESVAGGGACRVVGATGSVCLTRGPSGRSSKINRDGISAQLDDGVLTLTLPKAKEAQPRRIPIG